MIKKIIATIIFSVFCFCGAFCNTQNRLNYFDTSEESEKTYTYGIKPEDYGLALRNLSNRVKYFDLEGMAELIKKYREYNNPKFGISIYDLLNVCIAGGITYCGQNPTDPQCKDSDGYVGERVIGYDECMRFIDDLITVANERAARYRGLKDLMVYPIDNASDCSVAGGEWQKNPVSDKFECIGKDGYEIILSNVCVHAREGCVDIFKEAEFQQYTGLKLAELWGRKNGLTLTCADHIFNTSTSGFTKTLISMGFDAGQDFILCSAGGKPYAFEFNDLAETGDFNIESGVIEGICKLFNLKGVNQVYGVHFGTPNMVLSGGGNIPYSGYTGPHGQERKACENTNLSTCQEINRVATVAGYVARFENGDCLLEKEVKTEESLRTAYNINNRVFQSSVQVNLDSNIENAIRDYVSEHLKSQGIKLESFECNISSTKIGLEDFLTCYVNGKPVDFVFDDLSESFDYVVDSGLSKMACANIGGRIDDSNCRGLDNSACVDLDKKLKQRGMQGARYDVEQGGCILLDSQAEEYINLGIEIAGGVVLAVATGGGYVAVAVAASVATDVGFTLITEAIKRIPYYDYLEFMHYADECSDTDASIENQYCVAKVLNEYHGLIMGNMEGLELELQQKAYSKLQSMMKILSDKDVIKELSLDEISVAKQVRQYASFAFLSVMFVLDPDKLATKTDNLAKLINKSTSKIDDVVDATSKRFLMDELKFSSADADKIISFDDAFFDKYSLVEVMKEPNILSNFDYNNPYVVQKLGEDMIYLYKSLENLKINRLSTIDSLFKYILQFPFKAVKTKLEKLGYNADISSRDAETILYKWGILKDDILSVNINKINEIEKEMDGILMNEHSKFLGELDEYEDLLKMYLYEKETIKNYRNVLNNFKEAGYNPRLGQVNNDVESILAEWGLPYGGGESYRVKQRMTELDTLYGLALKVLDSGDNIKKLYRKYTEERDIIRKFYGMGLF